MTPHFLLSFKLCYNFTNDFYNIFKTIECFSCIVEQFIKNFFEKKIKPFCRLFFFLF